jgi:hypothetical protein
MGGACWGVNMAGTTLVGATVEDNSLTGGACAYGFVANGVADFTVRGNTFAGVCSGPGDGIPGRPPDAPAPFLFDAEHIGGSRRQPEFESAQRSLVQLLRMECKPLNVLGYRRAAYPDFRC